MRDRQNDDPAPSTSCEWLIRVRNWIRAVSGGGGNTMGSAGDARCFGPQEPIPMKLARSQMPIRVLFPMRLLTIAPARRQAFRPLPDPNASLRRPNASASYFVWHV